MDRLDELGHTGMLMVSSIDRLTRPAPVFSRVWQRAQAGGWHITDGRAVDTSKPQGQVFADIAAVFDGRND